MNQSNQTSINISQIACHDCDLLQKVPQLRIGQSANCLRCNAFLFKSQKNSVDRSLAFAITGLILYVISNMFPLLSLRALGITQDETLISTSISLFKAEMPLLSIVVLFTTVIFPATTLLGTIFVLMQVKMNKFNDYTAPLFRFLRSTDTWGMLEIFMLALLVAMVKLGDVAEVVFGTSLYSFGLLIISLTMLSHSLNPHDVWSKLRNTSTQ